MRLTSTFALLDIMGGRRDLLKVVGGNGFGRTKRPTGVRVPVTITGNVVGAWGGDDGTSQEFQVDVSHLDYPDAHVLTDGAGI